MSRAGWSGKLEGAEVVPVALDLGPGDRGAHADEDVLVLFDGLGHQVDVADAGVTYLGEVEAAGFEDGPLALGRARLGARRARR